jgi:short-subunit dehydrogenase involved in D-alanine esterification of teichoic acids
VRPLSRRSIQGDVATKEGCTKIADQIKAKESVLHTLINCAGVSKGWRVDAHPEHREWARCTSRGFKCWSALARNQADERSR